MRNRFTTFCVAALCAVANMGVAVAQPELIRGAESKSLDARFVNQSRYVGDYQGTYCWLAEGRGHSLNVVVADQNMQPLRQSVVAKNFADEVLGATICGNRALVLTQNTDTKRHTVVRAAVVALDSVGLALGGTMWRTLDSVEYDRRDQCYTWATFSPNGQYIGLVRIVEYKKDRTYTAIVSLADSSLNTLWEHEYAIGTTDEVAVTNDGTVVAFGYERTGQQSHFFFNVIGRTEANTYESSVGNEPFGEVHLAGVVGRRMLAMGTTVPNDRKKADKLCTGMVAMAFDIDSGNMVGFTLRPFTNEDINIFLNQKTKKIQKDLTMNYVSVCGMATTSYGAVMCLGRNYQITKTEDNGTETDTYYRTGLNLVAMDTTGDIVWVRNLRRNDMRKGSENGLSMSLIGRADEVVLLINEHTKSPATYDIAKDAKQHQVGDGKSNLVLYRITHGGDVSKLVVEQKTPQVLLLQMLDSEGNHLYITHHGNRSRMAKLKY